jgi:uncharacterized damage-inducible protein DinB
MQLVDLQNLYRHMEWADACVWAAVLKSEPACADEKLRGYFYHLHLVQHAWLRAWRGELADAGFPTCNDAESIYEWGRSYYDEIFAHLESLSDEAIAKPMRLPWAGLVEKQIGREPAPGTTAETMQQVAMHSLYHRGQINARLREVGGEPPTVDYLVWIWLDRPRANWPARG